MNVRITDINGKKPSFVQWDVDRVLYIEGTDSQPCLHFANPMLTRAIVVEAEADGSRWSCRVPNIILQYDAPIVISVFVQPDEGKTVLTDWVKVQPKLKPQDYTYEENIGYTNWVQKTQEAEELLATLEETCDQAQDLVEDIQGKLERKELQGNSIWTTTETPMPASGGVAFTQLTGRSNVPPIVGDIIVRSSRYVYDVVEVTPGGVVIGHLIGDIKGEQGVADTIWRTTASIGSVYPFGYVVNVSDLVGRSGATPKAGDIVLGPESGQTGDPTYLYAINGVGSSAAGLDGIGSIKGATGATGPQGPGVTEDLRAALLQLAQKVAYVDEHGADYYQDLYNALYLPSDIVFITAVFNQGTTKVMDTDSLDSLKPMLTVFGRYDDNTSVVLANYTLTGVLTPGTSTVTVSALGKTTTFDVFVTGLTSISAVYTQSGTVYDTDTLDSLKTNLVVTAHYSDSSTQTVPAADYTLSGTLTVGTSTITVSYGGKTTTFSVTVTDSGYLYYWDFTDSLVDRVSGKNAILQNVERSSDGIVFNALEKVTYVNLSKVFARGRSIEIDLKNVSNISTSSTAVILLFGITQEGKDWDDPWINSVANGFGYHYSATAASNRFGIISSESAHWGYPSSSSVGVPTYLNGTSCTIRADVAANGEITIYKDGVNMNILYNNAKQVIPAGVKSIFIGTPSESSSYYTFANMTVTGVRIREVS